MSHLTPVPDDASAAARVAAYLTQIEALVEATRKELHHLTASASTGQSLTVSIREAAELIGIGRTKVYNLMDEGVLPSRKVGKRRIILRADVLKYLAAA